jgi:DoxX.
MIKYLSLILLMLLPQLASAHVKWFSGYSYAQAPIALSELNHLSFWLLVALSFVTVGLFVYANSWFDKWPAYVRLNKKLETYSANAGVILRIFTGAALLLSWQADSIIAPELKINSQFWGYFQFLLALLMLGVTTSAIAGAGMILLYIYAITQYGMFHLADYLVYAAIGYFLLVSQFKNARIYNSRIPALYIGLGFSLCWAALEKIFYPTWGLEVLQQQPGLTMGLPPEFFLLACAFVEVSLGYLLIIGLLQRPLALTITLVFFTTTAFFGKTEIVGHTILHGALLVFIVVGPGGYFRPPIDWHRGLLLRVAFACVNFLIVGALLAIPYHYFAQQAFEKNRGAISAPHDEAHERHNHDQ